MIVVGLAKSENMVKDGIKNRFMADELINEKEFNALVERALDKDDDEVQNCSGHENKWLPENRITVELEPGDKVIWAQHRGKRRNQDGSGETDFWSFHKAEVEVRP